MSEKINQAVYCGRFAPTPSGMLHWGSVATAMCSYIAARQQQGKWLLRIDNIDMPRVKSGAEEAILQQLDQMGMHWDGPVHYQQHFTAYEEALDTLFSRNLAYPCYCSRKQLKISAPRGVYPQTCRDLKMANHPQKQYAMRLKTDARQVRIQDQIRGRLERCAADINGDFIIKRADKVFSYHLSCVIDDFLSGVNHVVRGIDLLNSSFQQAYLINLLDYPLPTYLHVPLLVNTQGLKLSKSSAAQPFTVDKLNLIRLARLLGQNFDDELSQTNNDDFWSEMIKHWRFAKIPLHDKIACIDQEN